MTQTHCIDDHTRLVGLIGWSAEVWASPLIYNKAFEVLGLNWRSVPLQVPKGRLREALSGLRALGFAGAEARGSLQCDVLKCLDELSPAAAAIGAVNLIHVQEYGSLIGDNTRWRCFLGALHTMAPSLNGLRPLVIGASETARSVVYALMREGLSVTVVNRDVNRAIDLVHSLRHVLAEHSLSVYRWPHDLARVAGDADLIINTISLQEWPDADRSRGEWDLFENSPWPDDLPISPDALVFDLSQPGETHFLCQARASGARAVGGLALLVYEAALALERWTGQTPPLEVMFQVAEQALAEKAIQDKPRPVDVFAPALS